MALTSVRALFDRHPGLGLAMLASYYPLPVDLLDVYADDWDWGLLSQNPRLGWTDQLLDRYRARWVEPEIWTNPGIAWTAERITRLLGKQTRDEWFYLSQNPGLPVDEAFLTQFAEKMNWSWLSQNHGIPWTSAMLDAHGKEQFSWVEGREQLLVSALHSGNVAAEGWASSRLADKTVQRIRKQVAEEKRLATTVAGILEESARTRTDRLSARPLAEWDEAWLSPLKDKISWLQFTANPQLPWSLDFLDRHAESLEWSWLEKNQTIWQKVLAPQITEADVRHLLATQFPHKFLKYFELDGAGQDSQGCLPSVLATQTYSAITADRHWAKPKVIDLIHDTLMEGPPRFLDFVKWRSNKPEGHLLVVSERLAEALKSLSLPEHATYEARVRCNPKYQRKYGKEAHRYVVLHFLRDTFLKQLDLARTPLCIWSRRGDDPEHTESFPAGAFATIEEALAKRDAVIRARPKAIVMLLPEALHPRNARNEDEEYNFASPLFPLHFHGDSDLIWIFWKPVVSETFRALVAAQGFTGMSFERWGNDSLFFAEAETEASKSRKRQLLKQLSSVAPAPVKDHAGEVFRALEARRDAILTRQDRVAEMQRAKPAPKAPRERDVQAVERKLDVQFPPLYRAAWSEPQLLPYRGEWTWLPLGEVFCIGDDWHQSRPESVRAVAVASNGLGDFIGFLLREDSMTQLADTLVEFKHESAQIEPLPGRLQLKEKVELRVKEKVKPQVKLRVKEKVKSKAKPRVKAKAKPEAKEKPQAKKAKAQVKAKTPKAKSKRPTRS